MGLLKGTKLYSIFTGTCPVCQEESMYKESNPYKLSSIHDMHEHCSHCGTKYKIEPSFFYGAMYVSYGVGVAFAVATFIIAHVFLGAGLLGSFISIVAVLILAMPLIMRLSRNIWINFFFSYKGKD
ncbi:MULTISPECIES: DUF983 domain-containing protein [Mesonia]|uniref:Uncharacterized protein n=1 Tax=Mesonia oceanica TaxID=2687242 RepID=A0AC61Y9J0_9FLAO|nr:MULTISPECIES: DUF983 domain-containing protein [Mesonia]MAN27364.1 DUF983 domain-containing protein [Mesonia sp.]MAQ40360.1 DUF983 domain-containing protein [Mesonia sp.]MBJ97271.1 DUF983 domain-containing protein [Flavobacteriaceae bacterium]VVV00793.1 hypothetical protein FVB9532_02068 [Mesonia oceanica]|tara:strand:+ start:215 stop:592 length:378 start_codon:yes stop_codon:yes gene_type:complete